MTMTSADSESTARSLAADLLSQMTLEEKVGQMTQVEKNSIAPGDIALLGIGSILSGGGGNPQPNTPRAWREMVVGFQREALSSRLEIPLIYGTDAVHGHNNVVGATIFPHNIGLGAAREPDLVRRIGRATASEVVATGVRWSFAPAVSIPHDIRWGRSYEGFGQDPALVTELAAALIEGFKGAEWSEPTAILPSVKHYVADGATIWGSSTRVDRDALDQEDQTLAIAQLSTHLRGLLAKGAWMLDQGASEADEESLRRVHLEPYRRAIEVGALNVMASYSSWAGVRMHEHEYLLTQVLKGELGFQGFIVTDWEAVDQISSDYYQSVVGSINAGIDMVMVPFRYHRFIETLLDSVARDDVQVARIDDAVTRILYVKARLGLFDRPISDARLLDEIGSVQHRATAREAVRKSLVLLKNDDVLPLPTDMSSLLVAGAAADDIGYQCGGWTISWMGKPGPITTGTTLLEGIRKLAPDSIVHHCADGAFDGHAAVGIVVLAEEPYAEGMGDRQDLSLSPEQRSLLERVRSHCDRLVLLLLSGRPLIITEQLPMCDAAVACWLPGSEGDGVAEVLFGAFPFSGRLSFAWPRSMEQVPLNSRLETCHGEPLYPLGYGLTAPFRRVATRGA